MKRLILGLFVIFGLAVNVANAEELNGWQEEAKKAIEEYEAFKAKYPKTYNACMSYGKEDSKNFDGDICYRLFSYFTAIKFEERDGERFSKHWTTWRELVKEYGEEETKKRLLKYGLGWTNGVNDIGIAEKYAKRNERR